MLLLTARAAAASLARSAAGRDPHVRVAVAAALLLLVCGAPVVPVALAAGRGTAACLNGPLCG